MGMMKDIFTALQSRQICEQEKTLPDEGAWIQVIIPPHAEISAEPLSCWYAVPYYTSENWELLHEFKDRYRVKIITPVGELCLYPGEYSVLSRTAFDGYIQDADGEHVKINWLDPRNEYFDRDRLFYILSKGIRKPDAYRMLLGEITSQNVCYLTFNVEYQRRFAGLGSMRFNSRSVVHTAIDNQLQEKAAGRWYNKERNANTQGQSDDSIDQ